MSDECKGCIAYYYNKQQKKYICFNGLKPNQTETDSCPCSNCLIKVVCEIECEDFKKYFLRAKLLNKDKG